MSKPQILVVDDDLFYASFVADTLTDRLGVAVTKAATVDEALALAQPKRFQLIILDVKMPGGETFTSIETAAGHRTGAALARELRRRLPRTKLLVHSIHADTASSFGGMQAVEFVEKTSDPDSLVDCVRRLLGRSPNKERPRAFIVHGRNHQAMLELKNYLQNRLGFREPIVLAEQPSEGKTLIEKFEHYASRADIVFVLATPDDIGYLSVQPEEPRGRPRLNVIFELGYFLASLQRCSGRIFLLRKDSAELPSDLAGIVTIDISAGIEAAGEEIRRQLQKWL